MKYKVIIELEIETSEYHDVGDSPAEAIDLVNEMLLGTADLPQNYSIKAGGATVNFNYYQPSNRSFPILQNQPV